MLSPMIVTVASYNIHKCAGLDRRVDLDRIADVLREINADLVGLQEVYRPQAHALAERLGVEVAMGPTRERDGLAYGNAVLTRLAVRDTRIFDLSQPDREPRGGIRLDLELPHEQSPNPYLDVAYTFRHFYARKVCFVKPSEGFVIFPGGFGTLDELFESLTLIQTGKVLDFPVVLFDTGYWRGLLDWIAARPLAERKISPEDVNLLRVTDDVAEAVAAVHDCWVRTCAEPQVHTAEKADAQ